MVLPLWRQLVPHQPPTTTRAWPPDAAQPCTLPERAGLSYLVAPLHTHSTLLPWELGYVAFPVWVFFATGPRTIDCRPPRLPGLRGQATVFPTLPRLFAPGTENRKPSFAFYVFRSFLSTATLLPRLFDRADIMAFDLFTPEGFFNTSMTSLPIIKSYSPKVRSNNTQSVPPHVIFPSLPRPTLRLGDLNIHDPTADPL